MTEDEDRWVLPREDIPPNERPDDVKDPPVEPVPDGGGQGSLDLPGNNGDLDVGIRRPGTISANRSCDKQVARRLVWAAPAPGSYGRRKPERGRSGVNVSPGSTQQRSKAPWRVWHAVPPSVWRSGDPRHRHSLGYAMAWVTIVARG